MEVEHAEPRRQKQDDRSAATRDKLMDGAYRIMRDLGHAGLRSANIARESGVSRGGLLHHYPTKEFLIAAVLERIATRMDERSWERIEAAPAHELLPAIVADATRRFFDESYKIQLDILIASGDEEPVIAVRTALRSRPSARDGWADRLAATGLELQTARMITSFLWNMAKGLAVRNLVQRDETHVQRVVALALELASRRQREALAS